MAGARDMRQLTEHVFISSVLNPSMRIFDVTMYTEYGTSYNSYIVKGSEKIALIDTAHSSFTSYYFDNLDEVLCGAVPDYLVLNHCEPDHSGSVAALLERYPDIVIVVSKPGAIYLKNIVNRSDYNLELAADGGSIDLGDISLRFIIAPFLHWPDSMFTWLEADSVLFTCDFLGAHYCEPQFIDSRILRQADYLVAAREYFDAIFSPFASYVISGLEKIDRLDLVYAATSHGPILTKGVLLEWAREHYLSWATLPASDTLNIPIFYGSAYGNTKKLAKSICDGIKAQLPGANVRCYDINEHSLDDLSHLLNNCDAFLVGSTTINRDAVPPIWHLLSNIEAVGIAGRPCATFGSYGWSGEAAEHLALRLASVRAKVFDNRLRVQFVPTADDLEDAYNFGSEFALSL
jgi:flavorubredoxin